MQHTIYYDPDDAALDAGRGWNVIENDGAVAFRYRTLEAAFEHILTAQLEHHGEKFGEEAHDG